MICASFGDAWDLRNGALHRRAVSNLYRIDEHNAVDLQKLLIRQLCTHCVEQIVRIESPLCHCCGMMFKSKEGGDRLCGDCIRSPKMFRMARAPVLYDQAFMDVIHCFKYKGKIQLAMPLGGLLLAALLRYWHKEQIDIVIPVPLYPGRLKKRGFNQAFLPLLKWTNAAKRLKLECPAIQIEKQALRRNRATAPQTGLGRAQRLRNIKNAFSVREPHKIYGKRILLVDDMYTTGATVNECARVLYDHGAMQIDVLTVARAM
jgi:ComF family protein